MRGWEDTVAGLGAKAKEIGATAILVDDREIWHGMDYYGRNVDMAPRCAPGFAAMTAAMPRKPARSARRRCLRILIASGAGGNRPMIRRDFTTIEEIGYLTIPLGPSAGTEVEAASLPAISHVSRTPEFEAKYHNVIED